MQLILFESKSIGYVPEELLKTLNTKFFLQSIIISTRQQQTEKGAN